VTGLGIFVFIVSLLFSIGLHEFGHFITAKKFGIKVEQFFVGFGPKLWSVRKGETEYGVKAIPAGGYVRIAGMNPFEEIASEDKDRVFKAKKPWQRAIVLSAGSFTHFVLALIIIGCVLGFAGEVIDKPTTTIASIQPPFDGHPSPAEQAGLRPGDVIIAVNGHAVHRWQDATSILKASPGKRVQITVLRNHKPVTTSAVLADHNPQTGTKTGFLGIGPRLVVKHYGPVSAITHAAHDVGTGMVDSLKAIGHLFSPSTIGRIFSQAAGSQKRTIEDPTTVVGLTSQAGGLFGHGDVGAFFLLIAYFNVFIGVANLLPLPPLDGGHLAVLGYEKIRRREVDMKRLIPITVTVISIFGSLFLLLLYLDIVRPVPGIPG